MAVVKNTFTKTLSSITSASHTITGLTSSTSTTSVSYVSKELSTQFLTSIWQSLLDAGYSDASMNTTDYSITVLGFKFFALCKTYSSSNFRSYPMIYTHGSSSVLSVTSDSTTYYINNSSTYSDLSYKIIIRGDSNCVGIWYGSYSYPNSEVPLIFIAKAKNLITGGDAYCYCNRWYDSSTSYYVYFKNKSDLYTNNYVKTNASDFSLTTYYNATGLNTTTKIICEPVLGYYGAFYIYGLIKCNKNFALGNYYGIGTDKYYCYGYKEGSSSSYSGSYLLMKIS